MSRDLMRATAAALVGLALAVGWMAGAAEANSVGLKVFAPRNGDIAGVGSRGFLVDLVARFDGDLASTGAALELTGPGGHMNIGPFPGDFGAGHDPIFPGLSSCCPPGAPTQRSARARTWPTSSTSWP